MYMSTLRVIVHTLYTQSIDDPDLKQTHPVTPSSVPAPRSDTAPHTETAGSTTSGPLSTTGPLSATSQEESEPDPNATYASVRS